MPACPALSAYEGRFRVHGPTPEVLEEEWPGTVVIIEFPDYDPVSRVRRLDVAGER